MMDPWARAHQQTLAEHGHMQLLLYGMVAHGLDRPTAATYARLVAAEDGAYELVTAEQVMDLYDDLVARAEG